MRSMGVVVVTPRTASASAYATSNIDSLVRFAGLPGDIWGMGGGRVFARVGVWGGGGGRRGRGRNCYRTHVII